jgi:hypothetical protein
MDIQPVFSTEYEQAYDSVREFQYLSEFTVDDGARTLVVDPCSRGVFRHREGYLLSVEAVLLNGYPDISVSPITSEPEAVEYAERRFSSWPKFQQWMAKHAELA